MAGPGAWLLTRNSKKRVAKGNFNIDTGSMKVALVLSTSNIGPDSTTWAGVTNEHANGNGYTTGGLAVDMDFTGVDTVAIVFAASPGNPIWTATGAGMAARWAVLYEVGGDVYAYVLLDTAPADKTASASNTFTVDSDGTPSNVMTVT